MASELRKYSPVITKPAVANAAFQHAGKHFDFVLGVDFHWTVTPLTWIPLPLPHAFVGIIFDIMDYIHFSIPIPSFLQKEGGVTSIPMGGSVMIFGRHKATTTTSVMGVAIPWAHLSGMFPVYFIVDKPLAPHEGEVYYGSHNVLSQGCEMGGNQPQHVLTCWSPPMGLTPLPTMPGKIKKNPLAYFAFYSRFLKMYVQINTGGPVLVGGTFQPHNYTIAEYLMRFAGMALMRALTKGISKALARSLKTINNKLLQPNFGATNKLSNALCRRGFEPVNFVTGEMSFEWQDVKIAGSTALICGHSWQSRSPFPNMFGKGVFSNLDLAIMASEDKTFAVWKHPDELIPVHIPFMEPGEAPFYYRPQKIWIERTSENDLTILYKQTTYRYTYFTDPVHEDTFRVTCIEHADGTVWKFEYHKTTANVIASVTDQADRQLLFDLHSDRKHVGKVFFQYKDEYDLLLEYDYDERGNLTKVFDSNKLPIQFVYDEKDRVVERINRNGLAYWWKYDALGRVEETSGANGFQHGKIVYHTDEGYNEIIYPETPGKIEKIFYDENGLIDYEVDALGGETWYDHNGFNERKMIATPEGRTTGYDYDEWGNIIVLHLPDGESIRYQYNDVGQLLMRTNANGNTESWKYDAEQRLSVYINAAGMQMDYEYKNPEDRLPSGAAYNNAGEVQWQYNAFGQLIQTIDNEGSTRDWDYDNYGRLIRGRDNHGRSMHWKRDELGRIKAIYETGQLPLKIQYDAYDLPVYASDGREEWYMEYTAMGSLRRKIRQSVIDKNEKTELIFVYDEYENMLAIRNEKQEYYKFVRNENDQVIEETGFDGQKRKLLRDADGLIIRTIQNDGKVSFHDYDLGGRLVYTHYSDGSWESFEYDQAGLLAEAGNPMGNVKFSRNKLGQVTQELQLHGHTVNYAYNSQGQLEVLTSSLGAVVEYGYDKFGYMYDVKAGKEMSWQMELHHSKAERKQLRQYTGNVRSEIEFDHTGLPVSQKITAGNTIQNDTQYTWKDGSRLSSVLNSVTGDRTRYDYDSFGNLSSAIYNGKETVYKNPDECGNIYKSTDRSDRKYGKGGKLLRDENWNYYYDASGNLILKTNNRDIESYQWQKGDWAYSWFSNGMLAEVIRPDGKKIQFEYDALGRRTAKISDGIIFRYIWNGNLLLHEWSYEISNRPALVVDKDAALRYDKEEPVGENLITWIYDNNGFAPCGKLVGDKQYSIIADYLGTPFEAYDESGKKVWSRQLDCFGKARKGDNDFVPFLFQGQYWDEETGLAYNRFRYYDCETGKYISKDPAGLPGGFELYNYVKDTNKCIDPFGLVPWEKGGFNEWFNKASVQDILDNKKSVEAALRAPGGKHEMFPVSIASKAKELGFTAEEIKAMSVETSKITFVDVPDGAGGVLEGKHHSSAASSVFHNHLINDLNGAKTKQDALDIIKKHHDAHMRVKYN